jgi:hypothetical protein
MALMDGPREILEAAWTGEKWIRETPGETAGFKLVLKECPGENHVMLYHDPKGTPFWRVPFKIWRC